MTALARVPSLTKYDRAYNVALRGNLIACECPAFSFGKKKGEPCKHLKIYEAAIRAIERCFELGHQKGSTGEDNALCRQCLVALLAVAARKVRREFKKKEPRKPKRVPDEFD